MVFSFFSRSPRPIKHTNHVPQLQRWSLWRNTQWQYVFSRAAFEGTNLGHYRVTIERIGKNCFVLRAERRHFVEAVSPRSTLLATDYIERRASSQDALAAEIRTLLSSRYNTLSDGTLVNADRWTHAVNCAATEKQWILTRYTPRLVTDRSTRGTSVSVPSTVGETENETPFVESEDSPTVETVSR